MTKVCNFDLWQEIYIGKVWNIRKLYELWKYIMNGIVGGVNECRRRGILSAVGIFANFRRFLNCRQYSNAVSMSVLLVVYCLVVV